MLNFGSVAVVGSVVGERKFAARRISQSTRTPPAEACFRALGVFAYLFGRLSFCGVTLTLAAGLAASVLLMLTIPFSMFCCFPGLGLVANLSQNLKLEPLKLKGFSGV